MKHLFTFRQRPNESLTGKLARVSSDTLSQVSAKCRPTVGRLSTLFLLLALTFGFSQQAWAVSICSSGTTYIYLDDSNASWTSKQVYFVWTSNDPCYRAKATRVSNTKLIEWYGNTNWGIDGVAWMYGDWGDSKNDTWSNITSWAVDYTSRYTGDFSFNNGNYAVISATGSSKNWTISPTYIGSTYSSMNKSITIAVKVDGTETTTPGKLTASSYTFSAHNSCGTSSSATLNAGSSSTTCTVGYTAKTTLTASDVDGYNFKGWYNGSTKISSDKSYTVYPKGGETYYAYYETIKYYLKKSNGSSEGTKIGTFTKTSTGVYTYTWTSNTSSKAYFYVSLSEGSKTNDANFLGGSELTDGTTRQVWLYGTSEGHWGDAQYITNPYNGVDYVFTFTITDGSYHIKCDYPKLYTGLSVTKTPTAGSADNPTISKTYVTQGQSVDVESKTAAIGYHFVNWTSTNGSFGTATDMSTTFTPSANNAQAVANYDANTYTITYTGDHIDSYTDKVDEGTYNTTVTVKPVAATDYAVDGITVTKTADGSAYSSDDDAPYTFTQPEFPVTVTVRTHSTAVTTYTIRFLNYDGTTVLQSGQVEEGNTPSYSGATPTKPSDTEWDYTFNGWTPTIAAATQAQDYTATYSQTRRKYALAWNYAGGSVVTEGTPAGQVANASTITAPTLQKANYTHSGWTPEFTGTMPAENVTYTAQWTENKYDVTINANIPEGATLKIDGDDAEWGSVIKGVGIETRMPITVTLNAGYKLNGAFTSTGGAHALGAGSSFTIWAEGANGTITVNLAELPKVYVLKTKGAKSSLEFTSAGTASQIKIWAWGLISKDDHPNFYSGASWDSKPTAASKATEYTDALGNVWYAFSPDNIDKFDNTTHYRVRLWGNNNEIYNEEGNHYKDDKQVSANSHENIGTIWIVPRGDVAGTGRMYTSYPDKIQTYTVTYNANNATSGTAPTDASSPYEVGTTVTVLGNTDNLERTGYNFSGWNEKSGGTGTDYAVNSTFIISQNMTLYAKWVEKKWTVTVAKVGEGTVTPTVGEHTNIGEVTGTALSATPAKFYYFDNWTVTEGTGSFNSNKFCPTSDATITATFTRYNSSLSPAQASYAAGQTVTVTPTLDTHYPKPFTLCYELWSGSSKAATQPDFTIGDNGVATFIAPTTIGTYTVKAFIHDGSDCTGTTLDEFEATVSITGEVKTILSLNFDNTKGNATISTTEVGLTSSATLTADNSTNTNYVFTYWEVVSGGEYITITGKLTDKTITVKGKGNGGTATIRANFACAWFISGEDTEIFGGWGENGKRMADQGDGIYTVTLPVNKIASGNDDFLFKVYNKNTGKYWAADGYWVTRQNTTPTLEQKDGYKNMLLRSDKAGDYVFTLTMTNTTKELNVAFPAEISYDVTVYLDGSTPTTVKAGDITHPTIDASQYVNGMRFNGWSADEGVTLENTGSRSTQITAVIGEGKSVRATYTTDGMVYFNKAAIRNYWTGDVYVCFYKGEYWDKDHNPSLGSGSSTSGNCTYGPAKMEHIANTDIYYYDYSKAITKQSDVICFIDQYLPNAQNFNKCSASYRTDFNTCANMFVPRDYIEHFNDCAYYSKGYWRTYQSTSPGYSITIWNNGDGSSEKAHGDFVSEITQGNEFKFTTHLDGNYTYYFKVSSCGGTWYGNQGTMTKDCDWEFDSEGTYKNNCGINASSGGDYTFTLKCQEDGWLHVAVEYPLSVGDYHVVSVINGDVHDNGYIYKASTTAQEKASFYVKNGATVKLQKCTAISGSTITWTDVAGQSISISGLAGAECRTYTITHNGASATLADAGTYTGDFYIRTDGVDGGWTAYLTNKDNKLNDYGSMLNAGAGYQFDYYQTKWIEKAVHPNVKCVVANDYSKCISDTLVGDEILGLESDGKTYKQVLPEDANVRFMWNSETNQLSRAYMSGSTDSKDRFLVLTGDTKIYDTNGNNFPEGGEGRTGLLANETSFKDQGNWVYEVDILANPSARGKLTAKYNNKVQYFWGSAGEFSDATTKQLIGGETSSEKYTIRAIYDFKTNLLITGWIPEDENAPEVLDANMIIVSHGQDAPTAITFAGAQTTMEDVKKVYAAIQLKKSDMTHAYMKDGWLDHDGYSYQFCNYYVSFPFDVKVSEIVGIDNSYYQIQKYNGQKRADIGWFAETKTFWEKVGADETLHAYEGYIVQFSRPKVSDANNNLWKNMKTEDGSVYLYFPSSGETYGDIVSQTDVTIPVPAHECKIDRDFQQDKEKYPNESSKWRNHKATDSHWNMIGTPLFSTQNGQMEGGEPIFVTVDAVLQQDPKTLKYYYKWDYTHNSITITASTSDVQFKAMNGYLVQYYGELTWHGVAKPQQNVVARKRSPEENLTVELQLTRNSKLLDRTYIQMEDGAKDEFVLNEDVYKMSNGGTATICSYANGYDVAANVRSIKDAVIDLDVTTTEKGIYTFSMPNNFSGTVILIDNATQERTNLQLQDYEINLNASTYTGRFQLEITVDSQIYTNLGVDQVKKGDDMKFIHNERMFIRHNGQIYDAVGASVK